MWPFSSKSKEDPRKALESLRASFELLNRRFEKREITNELFLQKSLELQKKMEKYEKQIKKMEQR